MSEVQSLRSPIGRLATAVDRMPTTMPARPLSVAIYMHDLSGGGVERQSLALAGALAASGVRISLVLHQLRGPLRDQVPPDLRIVDLQASRTLQDIPRLARFLRQEQPDILLANLDHNNVAALLSKALARSRTRVVICQHNPISPDYISYESWTYRLVPLAYCLLSPLIGQAVAVSGGVEQELRRLARMPRRKLRTIYNPVVDAAFEARSRVPVAHPWFHQPGEPVFVTAGRLVAQKDHETLLRALALHRQRIPGRLLILGEGPMRDRLGALAAELGVDDAVDFLGFQANPLPMFRNADAFILSSRAEGFGNVLVEAMACGTPVISTDCRYGPAEILAGGRFGTLVPPHDPVSLAVAMDGVAALRARCPADMLRARAAEFTLAACADRYRTLFEDLVHGQRVTA